MSVVIGVACTVILAAAFGLAVAVLVFGRRGCRYDIAQAEADHKARRKAGETEEVFAPEVVS